MMDDRPRALRWSSRAMGRCRWGEVSGKHVDLKIGDICDFEFLSGVFQVGPPPSGLVGGWSILWNMHPKHTSAQSIAFKAVIQALAAYAKCHGRLGQFYRFY